MDGPGLDGDQAIGQAPQLEGLAESAKIAGQCPTQVTWPGYPFYTRLGAWLSILEFVIAIVCIVNNFI